MAILHKSNKSGVFNLGVKSSEEPTNLNKFPNALMLGMFKRGDFNNPFLVYKENYREVLGYDPLNPYYIAVEDAFKIGVPYLWIMRVSNL